MGSSFTTAFAAEAEFASTEVKIDIPVYLKKGHVVFNMDHLAFSGDQPVGLKYMSDLGLEKLEQQRLGG